MSGELNLGLSVLGHWDLIYQKNLIGSNRTPVRGIPLIEIQEIPVLIESRVLAVSAAYLEARPTWNTAGWLYQEVDVPLTDTFTFEGITSGQTTLDVNKARIELNNNQLIVFDRVATAHRYRFEPAYWMPQLRIAIWAYNGPENLITTELLQALQQDIARIETKIEGTP